MFKLQLSAQRFIFLIALFFTIGMNVSFYSHVLSAYPFVRENVGFLVSLVIGYTAFNAIIFALFSFRYTLKPFAILVLFSSSFAAYFMDSYDILIDKDMLQNLLNTDPREVKGLLSVKLLLYLFFLGIAPSWIVYRLNIVYKPIVKEFFHRLVLIIGLLLLALIIVWSFSGFYGSFFREHKQIHHYANPAGYLSAGFHAVKSYFKTPRGPVQALGEKAHISKHDDDRELIIFVVGETARADHFSINGYAKKTNPLLEKEDVFNFTNVWSCGTSTLISVPCMFSNIENEEYERGAADAIENVMDVLKHAGVNTLWRDNNSSSKGVAERMEYQSFLTPDANPICDVECRDEGMLVGLDEYITKHPKGDIVIILHQMGSHGPGYYMRYPKKFEVFKPACQTNELKDCSLEEISNAYDNTIVYTDYFLYKVIAFLKKYDDKFETGMLYVGDHGESLGENGVYLHGMPLMFAPDSQRHVPAIIWLGKNMDDIDRSALRAKKDIRFSHENIFHTLLGFVEMVTDVYDPKKDILRDNH